ncbi:sialate O-acetylesterase [Hufsiella ginkgonis]|uniref:Sialate O-acetylesterase n=1 Tax=Hufsiella ginkgonis TaxID=2695274 RepID=A0A7K1XUN7_9SPHI|nr:sialate O-acetylesterase [Hufsiella ginkgonis]MXV14517.1 sialate O-acetylesterase [Hufsiella ginkgonis]
MHSLSFRSLCLRTILFAVATGFIPVSVAAKIRLPALVGNNMVLQRELPAPVWGWAEPGDTVSISFRGRAYKTIAAANGKWVTRLQTSKAGGPFEMVIRTRQEEVVINNVLVGDVWLCSGQSNMVLDFNNSRVKALYADDIAASANSQVRQILVNRTYSSFPQQNFKSAGWKEAGPANLAAFSAAAYFFATKLYQKYHVPIGLINSSVGGTVAEAWTSEQGLRKLPQFANDLAFLKDTIALRRKIEASKTAIDEWDKLVREKDKGSDSSPGKSMPHPGFWKPSDFEGNYGVVYFQNEINIPAGFTGDAKLFLGQIDDADITWFNGTKVGESTNRDAVRNYVVPAALIKPGINSLTVRVLNYNGTGGFFPGKSLSIEIGGNLLLLNDEWKYKDGFVTKNVRPGNYGPNNLPSALYNAMIAPLVPYGIKGMLWYQGEYNASRAAEYRQLLPALVTDWRTAWGQGDFPVVIQQLPNFKSPRDNPADSEWAELREAQAKTVASLPDMALSVAIDIGEADDIHPVNKKDVGYRMALAAQKIAYHQPGTVTAGPEFQKMNIRGERIELAFGQGGGLTTTDGKAPTNFAIAGADRKFVWASAKIKGKKVIVWSPDVKQPVSVRYAWADNPGGCNLVNREGLPASPFRTDDWPGMTEGKLYQPGK